MYLKGMLWNIINVFEIFGKNVMKKCNENQLEKYKRQLRIISGY